MSVLQTSLGAGSPINHKPIKPLHKINKYVKPHCRISSKLRPPEVFVVLCSSKVSYVYVAVPMGLVTPKCPIVWLTDRQKDPKNWLTSIPQSRNNTVDLLVWSEGSTVLQVRQVIVSADSTSVSHNTVGLENKFMFLRPVLHTPAEYFFC
jgi:hypothetical protein